jgi:hypothetical protein
LIVTLTATSGSLTTTLPAIKAYRTNTSWCAAITDFIETTRADVEAIQAKIAASLAEAAAANAKWEAREAEKRRRLIILKSCPSQPFPRNLGLSVPPVQHKYSTEVQTLEDLDSGKFVLRSNGEHYRTGRVVDTDDGGVLIKFDPMNGMPPLPMELVCMEELSTAVEDDLKVWGFFDTRAELDAFVNWLDSPDKISPQAWCGWCRNDDGLPASG